jgi:hypothetical protein
MPIVISLSSVPSDIGNYSGLIQTVVDTLKDDSLEERVPDFIALAEALFNRILYPLSDETSEALSATVANEGIIALPTDYKKTRAITYGTSSEALVLKQLGPDDFKARFLGQTAGKPEAYALAGNRVWIGPTPDATYSLTHHYVQGLQGLSQSNQTNWLIEHHPDVYFHGTLMYAELDGWNDERSRNFAETTMEILEQIKFWDAQRRQGDSQESIPGAYF